MIVSYQKRYHKLGWALAYICAYLQSKEPMVAEASQIIIPCSNSAPRRQCLGLSRLCKHCHLSVPSTCSYGMPTLPPEAWMHKGRMYESVLLKYSQERTAKSAQHHEHEGRLCTSAQPWAQTPAMLSPCC